MSTVPPPELGKLSVARKSRIGARIMSSTGHRCNRVTLSGCRVFRVFTLLRCHGRTRLPVKARQNIPEPVVAGELTAEEKLHPARHDGSVGCEMARNGLHGARLYNRLRSA